MKVVGWVLAAMAGVCAVVYLVYGLWTANWALQQSIVNHQAHLAHSGYEYQSTLAREINKNIAGVLTDREQLDTMAAVPGNKEYIDQRARMASDAGDVCQEADQATSQEELGPNAAKWVQINCAFGTLKPTSQYAIAQN